MPERSLPWSRRGDDHHPRTRQSPEFANAALESTLYGGKGKFSAGHTVSTLPQAIIEAVQRGWRLFPVKSREKLPLISEWPARASSDPAVLEAWAREYPRLNWGVATGQPSNVFVVDVDGKAGRASLIELERRGFTLPATLTVTTGRADGGEHRYFRMPSGVDIHNDQSGKIGAHIDARGTGGFVVCPPSVHASGKAYHFVDPSVAIADAPGWVIERLTARRSMPIAAPLETPQAITKGGRTKLLVSLAGMMHRRGMSPEAIEAALLAENTSKCVPSLLESKVRAIAADIVRRYPADEPSVPVATPLSPMTQADAARITGELLETIKGWILAYVVVGTEQAEIMSAWILHTYVFEIFEITPYLFISSPEKGSGKSTLLRILKALACRGRFSSGTSGAALARVVKACSPSLFLDEMDTQMKGDKEKAEAIRGILNSGYEAEGVYTRCVGNDFAVTDFPTFCPKCLAGIGELWDTVADRSITIEMRRMLPGETVEPDRKVAVKIAAAPIKARLEEWTARGAADLLRPIHPTPIPGFNPRQNDIAEVLLTISQMAGGQWPQRITQALKAVCRATKTEDASIGVTLLSDICAVFDEQQADTVPSAILAGCLCKIEGRPWADWNHGKGLTANNLARQLKRFGVYPQTIRVGGETPKGYRLKDFGDVWSRYCPSPPFKPQQRHNPRLYWLKPHFQTCNTSPTVAVAKSDSNPHEQRSVADVAVQNGGVAVSEVRI